MFLRGVQPDLGHRSPVSGIARPALRIALLGCVVRLAPFGELQVAGDHGGGALVALGDQIVEVLVLPGFEGLEPEVIDDKQRHPGESLHLALDGARGTSGIDLREQVGLRGEHYIVAPSHRAVTDGLGDMALAGAAGTGIL